MNTEQPWHHFKQRGVRDLAWALFNPSLFSTVPTLPSKWLQPIWQDDAVMQWLSRLDQQPSPLLQHLKDQRATRLGIYFEQLLSFFFSQYPRFRLIAKNLQANAFKRTIGEYDFIVLDHHDQQYYHIEVAVKFYIGLQHMAVNIAKNTPIYNWHLWVGPNKKDSLGIKMVHLMEHQLTLSKTKAGKEALASIGLCTEQVNPKLLLTGRLYLPQKPDPIMAEVQSPEYSSAKLSYSTWLNNKHLASTVNTQQHYIILPRQLWMAELSVEDMQHADLVKLSAQQLIDQLDQTTNPASTSTAPLHIAAIDKPSLTEQQRFFVIND